MPYESKLGQAGFAEKSEELRKEERLRKEAYRLAAEEVARNKQEEKKAKLRNSYIEEKKKKINARPKHAQLNTWGDWFDEQVVLTMPDQIYDSIDITSMPRWANIVLMISFIATMFTFFVYFTYAGISGAMSVKFISLTASNAVQECNTVPAVVTGTFTADKWGRWNTDPYYAANSAIYLLEFESTEVTQDQYESVMADFGASLSTLGERMAERDLAWSLLAWTTVTYEDTNYGMRFTALADLQTLFSNVLPVYVNTYAFRGECSPEDPSNGNELQWPTTTLSTDKKILTASYDMGSYIDPTSATYSYVVSTAFDKTANPMFTNGYSPCDLMFDPVNTFGYDDGKWDSSNYKDTTMDIALDLRSMLTATAVNFGIIDLTDLIEVRSPLKEEVNFTIPSMPPFQYYVDQNQDHFEPIVCVPTGSIWPYANVTEHPFCLVAIGNNYMYPSMWSKSDDDVDTSNYCVCDTLSASGTASQKYCCNQMYLQIILVYETEDILSKIDDVFSGVVSHESETKWRMFELGAKYAGYMAENSTTGDINIKTELQEVLNIDSSSSLDFNLTIFETLCPGNYIDDEDEWTHCGALVWTLQPDNFAVSPLTALNLELKDLTSTTFVDPYGFTANKAYCENTIYHSDAFSNMTSTAPTLLVETFYECSYTIGQAFTDSIGNASATAGLYTFLVMYFAIRIMKRIVADEGEIVEHPRLKDYHDNKADDIFKGIVTKALKRIVQIGKGNALDPAFIELFKMDHEDDDNHFSFTGSEAGGSQRGSITGNNVAPDPRTDQGEAV